MRDVLRARKSRTGYFADILQSWESGCNLDALAISHTENVNANGVRAFRSCNQLSYGPTIVETRKTNAGDDVNFNGKHNCALLLPPYGSMSLTPCRLNRKFVSSRSNMRLPAAEFAMSMQRRYVTTAVA
jgi:hypothetical protein